MESDLQSFIKLRKYEIELLAQKFRHFKINSKPIEFVEARTRIIDWIKNFDNVGFTNYQLVLDLLYKINFVTFESIADILVNDAIPYLNDRVYIAPLGEVKESSFRLTARFNSKNNFFTSIDALLNNLPNTGKTKIFLFDDFLNSGGQIITIFKALMGLQLKAGEINDEIDGRTKLNHNQIKKLKRSEIHIFYYTAFDEGLEYLNKRLSNELNLNVTIHRHLAANKNDGAFGDETEQDRIINGQPGFIETHCLFMNRDRLDIQPFYLLLKEVGIELLRQNEPNWTEDKYNNRALGYGNLSRLIVTDYNVPTITLTAIWQGGRIVVNEREIVWKELFPRTKKNLTKKLLEENKNTLKNLLSANPAQIYDVQVIYSNIYSSIKNNFIKENISFNYENKNNCLAFYSKMYKTIIQTENQLMLDNDSNIFDNFGDLIISSNKSHPLLVRSISGCGKTTFLSLLYLNIYNKFINNETKEFPIFISLHSYNKFIYDQNKDINIQIKEKLSNDFSQIYNLINIDPSLKIILFIDGADDDINLKIDIDEYLKEHIDNLPILKKIVGVRMQPEYGNRDITRFDKIPYIDEPEIIIDFNKIKVRSELFEPFLYSFSNIQTLNIERTQSEIFYYLYEKITKFKLEEIDYYQLLVLMYGIKSPFRFKDTKTLSAFYKQYFYENNIKDSTFIKASELAFKIFNTPEKVTFEEKNSILWWKIQKHSSFRDYLVAYNVAHKIINYNPDSENIFEFVYPYNLNNFYKEIINEHRENQVKALKTIEEIVKSVPITARTHFCYLLGRLDYINIKDRASQLLKQLKKDALEDLKDLLNGRDAEFITNEDKKNLLYLRTIYISLTYLGDQSNSDEYISQLIKNRYFDNLNRGFHLEYYQDILFDPSSPANLKHEDNLQSFENTYDILYSRLNGALNEREFHSLFEIEMYTLCSLVQHRYISGALSIEKKVEISSLINLSKNKKRISGVLGPYLNFIKHIFDEYTNFSLGSFILKLYNLKSLKRSGWVERKISDPETVGSHMYGAYLLGYFYLPDYLPGNETYDKQRILNLILIHDIAEAEIGDYTPKKKTNEINMKEKRFYEVFSYIGTFRGFANVFNLHKDFQDFTHGSDINSIIAREIDKLDNLLQLHIYKNEVDKVSYDEFDNFKNDLNDHISTDIGKSIQHMILSLFEGR